MGEPFTSPTNTAQKKTLNLSGLQKMLIDATGISHTYLLFKPEGFGIWESEHVEIATNLLSTVSYISA